MHLGIVVLSCFAFNVVHVSGGKKHILSFIDMCKNLDVVYEGHFVDSLKAWLGTVYSTGLLGVVHTKFITIICFKILSSLL